MNTSRRGAKPRDQITAVCSTTTTSHWEPAGKSLQPSVLWPVGPDRSQSATCTARARAQARVHTLSYPNFDDPRSRITAVAPQPWPPHPRAPSLPVTVHAAPLRRLYAARRSASSTRKHAVVGIALLQERAVHAHTHGHRWSSEVGVVVGRKDPARARHGSAWRRGGGLSLRGAAAGCCAAVWEWVLRSALRERARLWTDVVPAHGMFQPLGFPDLFFFFFFFSPKSRTQLWGGRGYEQTSKSCTVWWFPSISRELQLCGVR